MPQRPHIVIIEDESTVCDLLARLLKGEGYTALTALTGTEGLRLIEEQIPQLLILDLNLPDLSGHTICTRLRSDITTRHLPILVLTGRDVEGTAVRSLDAGADDYIAKPFNNSELLARVRALLRRSLHLRVQDSAVKHGFLRMDNLTRQVRYRGRLVRPFSPKEFNLLKQLVLQAPQVVSKESLILLVWNSTLNQTNPRTVDVHIRRIRMKLGPTASACLRTVPHLGYQWIVTPKSS